MDRTKTPEARTSDRISIASIQNPGKLLELKSLWDSVVRDRGTNPFLFSGFLGQFMRFRRSAGWRPLLLLLTIDGMAVGTVALMMKNWLGIHYVTFLSRPSNSPDFVLEDQYRVPCMERIIKYLFGDLRTTFLDLTIPSESPNLSVLKMCCDKNAACFRSKPLRSSWGHRILRIHGSWNAYRSSRGHDFKYNIKRIERDLGRAGSWRIMKVDGPSRESDIIRGICEIEGRSWKENWRRQTRTIDEDLRMMFRGARCVSESESGFRWSTCFLELDGKALAYALIVEYKRAAYLVKTSFDERYRRLNIGAYVINEVFHELFDREETGLFDFMTDWPFMERWTSVRLSRTRVVMCRKGLPSIIGFFVLHTSIEFMWVWQSVLNRIPALRGM